MKTSAKKSKYGRGYAKLSTESAGGHKSLTHTETNEIRKRERKREKWELHKNSCATKGIRILPSLRERRHPLILRVAGMDDLEIAGHVTL
jgi:hypothetical protein